MNVAPRLISLSPPAFRPIHFVPTHPNRPQVSFARTPTATIQPQIPILSTLCFHGLTNCFFRKPFIFKDICVAPRVCPPNRFSKAQLRRLADCASLSPSLSTNCGLLFSLAALFRTPILCFQCFADSFAKTGGVAYPAAQAPKAKRLTPLAYFASGARMHHA